jgi:hypothetical protein
MRGQLLPEGDGTRRPLLLEGEGIRVGLFREVEGIGRLLSQADGKESNHPLAVQEELLRSLQDGTRGTGRQKLTISQVAEWAGGET